MLLDWISRADLRKKIDFSVPFSANPDELDKCCRLLPLLAELIVQLNSATANSSIGNSFRKRHLSFLEFIYWSLLVFDSSFQHQVSRQAIELNGHFLHFLNSIFPVFQKLNLSSTLRRIGEELYRSYEKRDQPESYKSLTVVSSSSAVIGSTTGLTQKTASQGLASMTGAQNCLFSQFLQSDNPHARLLSCLIILRTLTQGTPQSKSYQLLDSD